MSKNVLENIRQMRQKVKEKEVRYYPNVTYGKKIYPKNFKDGKNYFRVAPSHDPEANPSPFYPLRTTTLEVELGFDKLLRHNLIDIIKDKSLIGKFRVDKIDDLGDDWTDDKIKDVLKKELGESFKLKVRKSIFISTLHGTEDSVDLVEEYIKFVVQKINDEIGDRDEVKKNLSPIFGWRDNNVWHFGISPSTSFVFYAWDWSGEKTFHEVNIYGNMMDKIEELYARFDDPEEPLTVDPFSDPKEGVAIIFDKGKNDKGKDEYSIYDQPFTSKFETLTEFKQSFAITEEQMKQFKEVKPLVSTIGKGVFKRSDFELQLNGLVLFDNKHGYNAFENDEFLEIVQLISEQYPEEEETLHNPLTGEGASPESKEDAAPEVDVPEEDDKTDLDKVLNKKPGKVAEKEKKVAEVKVESEVKKDSFKEEKSGSEKDKKVNDKLAALRKKMNKG